MTIPAAVADAAAAWPNGFWLGRPGEEITFGELAERVEVTARALAALGVERGSRVGLFMGNRALWLEIEYAVTSLGAVLVPLNTMLTAPEVINLLNHSQVSTLVWADTVVGRNTIDKLEQVLRSVRVERLVGVGDGPWPTDVRTWDSVLEAADTIDPDDVARQVAAVRPDDVALVIYTSGTTGAPKGVMQTHRAIVTAGRRFARHLELEPEDRSIFWAPLYWIYGCWLQAMIPLAAGSGTLLEERFNASAILDRMRREGCTHLSGIAAQQEQLVDELAGETMPQIRIIGFGGTTSSPEFPNRLVAAFPKARLMAGYGLSESGTSAYTPLGAPLEDVSTTVGRIHEGGAAKVVAIEDPTVTVPHGTVGELLIRTDCLTVGYLDDPAATEKAFVDGWLRTGDLARMDDREYITILGRNQDSYKRSGATVYTIDAETVLVSHPDVQTAAVVGVSDELVGQVGVAYVELSPGAAVTDEDLIAYCTGRLASYKVPSKVVVVEELPRTPSGKVRKNQLKDAYTASGASA
ncbi:class I adenylate-forming enzyme family protein [Rhodococcus aetherivorans]